MACCGKAQGVFANARMPEHVRSFLQRGPRVAPATGRAIVDPLSVKRPAGGSVFTQVFPTPPMPAVLTTGNWYRCVPPPGASDPWTSGCPVSKTPAFEADAPLLVPGMLVRVVATQGAYSQFNLIVWDGPGGPIVYNDSGWILSSSLQFVNTAPSQPAAVPPPPAWSRRGRRNPLAARYATTGALPGALSRPSAAQAAQARQFQPQAPDLKWWGDLAVVGDDVYVPLQWMPAPELQALAQLEDSHDGLPNGYVVLKVESGSADTVNGFVTAYVLNKRPHSGSPFGQLVPLPTPIGPFSTHRHRIIGVVRNGREVTTFQADAIPLPPTWARRGRRNPFAARYVATGALPGVVARPSPAPSVVRPAGASALLPGTRAEAVPGAQRQAYEQAATRTAALLAEYNAFAALIQPIDDIRRTHPEVPASAQQLASAYAAVQVDTNAMRRLVARFRAASLTRQADQLAYWALVIDNSRSLQPAPGGGPLSPPTQVSPFAIVRGSLQLPPSEGNYVLGFSDFAFIVKPEYFNDQDVGKRAQQLVTSLIQAASALAIPAPTLLARIFITGTAENFVGLPLYMRTQIVDAPVWIVPNGTRVTVLWDNLPRPGYPDLWARVRFQLPTVGAGPLGTKEGFISVNELERRMEF